jgi:hypothetical protein
MFSISCFIQRLGEFELLSMFSMSCIIQRLGELELLSMFSMSCIIQRLGELELLSMFSLSCFIQRLGELELLSMFSMSCIIQRLGELELSLQHHQDMNNTLEDQLHKTRHLDAEHQDRMENTQRELNELKRKLKEAENRAQVCSNEIL